LQRVLLVSECRVIRIFGRLRFSLELLLLGDRRALDILELIAQLLDGLLALRDVALAVGLLSLDLLLQLTQLLRCLLLLGGDLEEPVLLRLLLLDGGPIFLTAILLNLVVVSEPIGREIRENSLKVFD